MSVEILELGAKPEDILQAVSAEIAESVYMDKETRDVIAASVAIPRAHVLAEGGVGVGKTTTAKALSVITGGSFGRIQGGENRTADEITGGLMYDPKNGEWKPYFGPIVNNFLLADEYGRFRTDARDGFVQPMEEGILTIGDTTYNLPNVHKVFATQNPVKAGRHEIDIANRDRFMIHVLFPDIDLDKMIKVGEMNHDPRQRATIEAIESLYGKLGDITVDGPQKELARDLIGNMRNNQVVDNDPERTILGSVRPWKNIIKLSRGLAMTEGKPEVSQQHVVTSARFVLRHRVALDWEAEDKGITFDDVYDQVSDKLAPKAS